MRRPLVLTIAASMLALPLTMAPATADGSTPLSLDGFSDVLVDQAGGHVFVTGGTASSSIVVTNLDGVVQTPIPNAYGAAQMLLSQDGSKVYLGLAEADGVGVINTTTLAMTKISTGANTCPYDVAQTTGRIWYSYGCGQWSGAIGYIDLTDNSVHPAIRTGFYSAPQLESSPALPGQLAIADRGISPSNLVIATVTEGSPVTLPTDNSVETAVRDMAITPDGTRIVTTDMAPYVHPVFLTSDLSGDGSYATGAYPNAVAIRSDGMVAAGIDGPYDPDVWVYPAGSRTLLRSYELGGSSSTLAPGGLAFGTTRLYAVAETGSNPAYTLRVITPAAASSLTIRPNATTYSYGGTAAVTVHLTSTSTNRQVSIYAKPLGGTEQLLKTGTVDGNGNLIVATNVVRRTTFRAAYAGGAGVDGSTATTTVTVRAKVTPTMVRYVRRKGPVYLYKVTKSARIIGTVAPNHANDCLYFFAEFYVHGSWGHPAKTGCVPMTSTSKAMGILKGRKVYVGLKIRLRAEWRGDGENAAQNSPWRYARFIR